MGEKLYNFGRGTGEGGSGGGTLIAFGSIRVGNVGTANPTPTVTGDISTSSTIDAVVGTSTVNIVFVTPLTNNNYHVMFEIETPSNKSTFPLQIEEGSKTLNGFTYTVQELVLDTQDLLHNIRIESLETSVPDMTYIPISGTNQIGPESSLTQTATGSYSYDLTKWTGTGYNSSRVRTVWVAAKTTATSTLQQVFATLPDGVTEVVISTNRAAGGGDSTINEDLVAIPINQDQTTLDLRISRVGDIAEFTIHGVSQTAISTSSSPPIEMLSFKGQNASATPYVESTTLASEVWASYAPLNNTDWSDALPLVINENYTKTRLDIKSPYSAGTGDREAHFDAVIIIDWSEGTVKGYWNQLNNGNAGGYFDGLTDTSVLGTNTLPGGGATYEIQTVASTKSITRIPAYPKSTAYPQCTITNFN
jgi:hypothetical protein